MTTRDETGAKVRRHLEHCGQYFDNGREALDKGEVSKAGEMFWGSVTQAFQALASVRGVDVAGQRQLKNFAILVSNEAGDPNIIGGFMAAEILYTGFYDGEAELGDIEAGIPLFRYTIDAVRGMIPGDFMAAGD